MSILDYGAIQRSAAMLMPELDAMHQRARLADVAIEAGGLQNESARNEIDAQQMQAQTARVREGQRIAAVSAFQANPTHKGALSLITSFPELREPVTESWKLREESVQKSDLRHFSETRALLMSDQPERAIDIVQKRIALDREAGEDVEDDEAMLETMRQNPKLAAAQMTGLIGAIVGPEKIADTVAKLNEDDRATAMFPTVQRRAVAEAGKAEVDLEYAPKIIESNLANDEASRANITSMVATRAAQVDIARDTLETNVQLRLDEFEQAGLRPDPGSVGIMNQAVVSGSTNAALAEQTRGLADQFAASDARGGMFSGLDEVAKGVFGRQDAVSLLRSRYAQLRNSTAIKSLPPGPASDKDIKLAREGFPSPSAPREYLVSWLRGMAKMQDIAAAHDNGRAEWIASNGNLGTARRDLMVNGVRVPRGTSYVDYQKRSAATANRQALPPRSYLQFAQ